MGRFDPKYTDEQREAIASAMIDRGMSAPEAVKAASEGLDGLEPFTVPESTARDIAGAARQQRPPVPIEDYGARLRGIQERGMVLLERELTRVEKSSEQGKLTNPDWTQLTKLMRFGRALRDLGPAPQPSGAPPAKESAPAPAGGTVDAMLARLNAAGNGDGDSHGDGD